MKILIVEDEPFKLSQIRSFVERRLEAQLLAQATSLQGAIEKLSTETFDVVLLDMALPSHSEERGTGDIYSQPVGGLDVLLHLSFSGRKEEVIVLTQYPTVEYDREHVPLSKLKSRLLSDDIKNVLDVVLFSPDGSWEPRVIQALEQVR